ncbi:TniB family NTP-binding protein [Burkholderia lata]|uniref:TniB family protein n=1 Tax=Burkholderia lata (strain ATCC 17760 / DSM 23089 / LMG 22485 / NCIMB 9086 / R18194 / 383) TaxID=482957 RepID=A0A6P2IPG5_BURL3|nr:TniB family NTP-binding protein [Burkholderia lata]VWB31871.1 TniB family protein [Burkholderia lata]
MKRFNVRKSIVEHPDFVAALKSIEDIHQWLRESGEAGCLATVGESGAGKSTVLECYRAKFPVREEALRRHVPVLYVIVPAVPTVRSLAEAILIALGEIPQVGQSSARLTEQIVKLVHGCGVEIIMLDEFQHFVEGDRRSLRQVANWLKVLLDRLPAAVVLSGLPSLLGVLRVNGQLRRRFSRVTEIRRFDVNTQEGAQTFIGVMQALAKDMPLPMMDIADNWVAMKLYYATAGLVDYMCKLLNGAYQIAERRGAKSVVLNDFAAAFVVHIWKDAPPSRNPFNAKFNGDPLNKPGEPFAGDVQ